jgi:hypothetical protein
MGLAYLTKIAATNFICAGIRRHSKSPPPHDLFGLLRGALTLSRVLLFGLPPTFGLVFSPGPALVHGRPLGIAFRVLAARA